jgi:hypothetical protein
MDSFLSVMSLMESEFACSGVCKPNLFWFTRPMTNPSPTVRCLDRMTDIVTNKFLVPGLALLVAGLTLFVLFIVQYFLWCNNENKYEQTES